MVNKAILDKLRFKAPNQMHIEIPHVGTLSYYAPMRIDSKHRNEIIDAKYLTLEELRKVLPKSSRIPTLAEDNLIAAYVFGFPWVELDTIEYGPISFWGKRKGNGYERLFFRTKSGNVELVPLIDNFHYVDTQLKDYEPATKKDFERVLEEQGLDPAVYEFPEGIIATVLERDEEVGRTYIADGQTVLVLHRRFGTPLVAQKGYSRSNLDMPASKFPEDFHDTPMCMSNAAISFRRELEDYGTIQLIRAREAVYSHHPRSTLSDYQGADGFYAIRK